MKILITGYTGYLGSSFLNIIKKNYPNNKIYCISSKNVKKKYKFINYKKIDLNNFFDVEQYICEIKPEILFHFAWKISNLNYKNSLDNFISLKFSKNLYFLFCKYGGKRAYLIGTEQEYDIVNDKLYEIKIKKNNHNYYSLSKYYFYNYVEKISTKFNSQFTWFRVFFSYGSLKENQFRLIPSLINSFFHNKQYILENPNKKIHILHIEDVVRAIYLIFSKNITGIVNIASKKKVKIIDIQKFIFGQIDRIGYFKGKSDKPKIELKKLNSIEFVENFNIDLNLKKLKNIYKKKLYKKNI